jgi:hypothetical protein
MIKTTKGDYAIACQAGIQFFSFNMYEKTPLTLNDESPDKNYPISQVVEFRPYNFLVATHNKPSLRIYDRNEGIFIRSINIEGYHRGFSDLQFLKGSSSGWNAVLVIKSS